MFQFSLSPYFSIPCENQDCIVLYIDEVILQRTGSTDYYFTHDYRYSVTSLTNTAGTIVESYDYKVYGERTITGSGLTDVGYTGQRHDSETGLMYFKNRYYSTSTGSFVTRDPLGYVDGLSMYLGYFGGDRTDALGYFDIDWKSNDVKNPWSGDEKDVVLKSLNLIRLKIPLIIKDLNDEAMALPKNACYDKMRRGLKELAKNLLKMKSSIESDSFDLQLGKKTNEELRLMSTDKNADVRLGNSIPLSDKYSGWGSLSLRQLFDVDILNVNLEKFFIKENFKESSSTIFHELTHIIFRTEDSGDDFTNAHLVEELLYLDLKNTKGYKMMTQDAKRCYKFLCPAPDYADKDGWNKIQKEIAEKTGLTRSVNGLKLTHSGIDTFVFELQPNEPAGIDGWFYNY